ncbi:dihydroxyacetone kinase subunit DhaL [Paenibacillus sp. MSJ-34]|uniref:dihydroxyacetone kinase subunit DhaL n=1 Tax=Paenibacillus sp. MSJ-34 TaxID=2841529 RepID=UPI001C110A78|nr:dihydroxyacetone kinase subunit DhaL [Paenibacillus sp. MSJ-34]MBU5442284.1 dihydroxyacetone kinase subunit L [Paenibacillus sp. MSJ-34]
MIRSLNCEHVKNIIREIGRIMDENKDYLCQLDGTLGDGDIGLTMSKGFRHVIEGFADRPSGDIGSILMESGAIMGEKAASTMGTLMASALFRAGQALRGKNEVTAEDLELWFQAMSEGIMNRGKAKVGDKTILDAIVPATEAFRRASANGSSLAEAVEAASAAAEQGMERTIGMESQHGRAGRYLEKSIGHRDPGATVGALFFRGFADYVSSLDGA